MSVVNEDLHEHSFTVVHSIAKPGEEPQTNIETKRKEEIKTEVSVQAANLDLVSNNDTVKSDLLDQGVISGRSHVAVSAQSKQ